jgi:replicative DNA helicase
MSNNIPDEIFGDLPTLTEVQSVEKPLPSEMDAEKALLAMVFLNSSTLDMFREFLRPEDFYNPTFKAIYQSMLGLQIITPITIMSEAKRLGLENLIGSVAVVSGLVAGYLPEREEEIITYAQSIKAASVARQEIHACQKRIADLMAYEEPVEIILERGEARTAALTIELTQHRDRNQRIGFWDLEELVPEMHQQFEDYHEGKSNGVKTGMSEIDNKLDGGGLQPGGVYLIAGGEKVGKTSLALSWLIEGAMTQQLRCDVVTAEMYKITMAKRLYSAWSGIPYYMFRPGMFDSPEFAAFTKAITGLAKFGKLPIGIADKLRTTGQIWKALRKRRDAAHKRGLKYGFAVIDYIQLLELDGDMNKAQRVEVVTRVSRDIKLMANDLEIPIVAMSSLNRIGLTENQIPDTFNLRETGTLAFDAEAVMVLHNPAYVPGQPYQSQEITPITLHMIRQRNGPSGVFPLKLIGPYMQFMSESQFAKYMAGQESVPQTPAQAKQEVDNIMDFFDLT